MLVITFLFQQHEVRTSWSDLGALLLGTNGYNDDEIKAKLDAMEKRLAKMDVMEKRLGRIDAIERRQVIMEKRLSKMDAMEKRLAVVEQQEGKCLFTLN